MPRIIVVGTKSHVFPDGVEMGNFAGRDLPRDASIVIWPVEAMSSGDAVLTARQSDFNAYLAGGARIVIVFGAATRQRLPGKGAGTQFFGWLCDKVGIHLATPLAAGLELRSEDPQLQPWFAEQGATVSLTLDSATAKDEQVLARAVNTSGEVVGVAATRWRVGGAELIAVPNQWSGKYGHGYDAILPLLDRLPTEEAPAYLSALQVGDEGELLHEIEDLDRRRTAIDERLAYLAGLKRILYVAGADLEREVVRFLCDELGVRAVHTTGNAQDFWLIEEDGTEWCVGEVKSGENRNVQGPDVARLLIHRSESGKGESFPAVLVANTFFKKASVAERDEPIPHNIVRRAADDHILIVRTLDLFRMKQREFESKAATSELVDRFVEIVRSGSGGWLEITAEFTVVVHE